MKTFFATEKTNLKDFTDCVYPQGSFCFAVLLRNKDIKVNGVRTGKNILLNAGDEVVYYTTPVQEQKPSHTLIYSDENVYIADKLSGVSGEGLLSELSRSGECYAVHRLDRNTQGLIIFAKNQRAKKELDEGFKNRKIIKTYIALCKNNFKQRQAVLSAYLKKDEKQGLVKIYSTEQSGAEKIITEYCANESDGDITAVKIILHTGKTHQIRAHLAYIGCPVLGDEKYGDGELNAKYHAKRQRLIAKYLKFDLNGSLKYLNAYDFESKLDF